MNYTVGLSSETLVALKELGGFSIDKLAELYPVALRQTLITGWSYLAVVVLLVVFSVLWIFFGKQIIRKFGTGNGEDPLYPLFSFLLSISAIMTFIMFVSDKRGLSYLLNPKYGAIEKMLEFVRYWSK